MPKSKKVAYYATLYHHLAAFDLPFMKILQSQGYEIHAYGKPDRGREVLLQNNIVCYDINTSRSPVDFWSNIIALYNLVIAFKTQGYYMLHVDTPVASIIGRIAAKIAKIPVVIYTAHGFHFYKGASKERWLFYYSAEWLMAYWTDYLITINKEDYELAKKKFHVRKKILFIDGVGVNLSPFIEVRNSPQIRQNIRNSLGLKDCDFVVVCIAEMIQRKNQIQLIKAAAILKDSVKPVKCLMVGEGEELENYKLLSQQLGLESEILFLGYRRDIPDLLCASDISILLSKHEGLPKGLMESMAAGKPVVATNVRGNRDIVKNEISGLLVPYDNVLATVSAIEKIYSNKNIQIEMSHAALKLSLNYDIEQITKQVTILYSQALEATI